MTTANVGILSLVVEVESTGFEANPAGLLRLASQLDHARIPATWAFPAVRQSEAMQLLLGRIPAADLALLGERHWIGNVISRSVLSQTLDERISLLKELGKHPSSVCLVRATISQHLDLLVKHKIPWIIEDTAMSSNGSRNLKKQAGFRPKNSRYGLWIAEPAVSLPGHSTWNRAWQSVSIRSQLKALVSQPGFRIVRIRLAELIESPASWSQLEQLIRTAGRWRARGKLRVESLAGLTLSLRPIRTAPMRSILRAA